MEIQDDYDHPPHTDLEYILENIPTITPKDPENFIDYVNSELTEHCSCADNCESCTNYKDHKLLYKSLDTIHECNSFCSCEPTKCINRLVQKGPSRFLVIQESPTISSQHGLFSTCFLPRGTFICEYAGEIISRKEAEEREKLYSQDMNYIMCLNLKPENSPEINLDDDADVSPFQTFIDPTRKGNIGRYMNHSCEPNCDSVVVRVSTLVPKVGKLILFVRFGFTKYSMFAALFTNRDIEANTELTFSYGDVIVGTESKRPCLCGSSKCKGYLPNLSFS